MRAPVRSLLLISAILSAVPEARAAQTPTPEQVRRLLEQRPDLAATLRARIQSSGLTPEQIRTRLTTLGYPAGLLDQYLNPPPIGVVLPQPDSLTVAASQALGLPPAEPATDTTLIAPASSDSLPRFGATVFVRGSSLFQPSLAGPVDANYRLGPGDHLTLILTGEVELAHALEVSREGLIVIPQVGQLSVAGLTMAQLESLLYSRLGRVYSSVRPGRGATTQFQVTVTRLRVNQVFVVGDVARPGSYQISAAGTVLTALYAAGGPSDKGSFRRVQVRRGGRLVDSLDLYDYLLRGDNGADIRLETNDVVFVPVHGPLVKVRGKVLRPGEYEITAGGTLRDLLVIAGGFDASALRRRVQIDRILPPAQRQAGGRDRVVIDLSPEQFADGQAPTFPIEAGDDVKVFEVAERRRNQIMVLGNVWNAGSVGYVRGMRLSDAIRLAGGPKPDVYLDQILISRLRPDSTRIQLRSGFADSLGALKVDLPLEEDDEIQVFSRTSFRPFRWVAITGAVKRPASLPFRAGMTLRDAILLADGVTEDALLTEAEIARMPEDRSSGTLARTIRITLDSTYLFDRSPSGEYLGPPGLAAQAAGSPEVMLLPYDNILILRQPDWELQRTVRITGQVKYPGTYSLRYRTERLTDLVERAGGLTREAYPNGVEFWRRAERRGQIGVDLRAALRDPKHRDNLILVAGDSIIVPEFNPVVRVEGAVNSPISVAFVPGKDVDYYVGASGGYTRLADRGRAFVRQANGKVESVKRRFLLPDGEPRPEPGATVIVPFRDPADKKNVLGVLSAIVQILASTVAIIVVARR